MRTDLPDISMHAYIFTNVPSRFTSPISTDTWMRCVTTHSMRRSVIASELGLKGNTCWILFACQYSYHNPPSTGLCMPLSSNVHPSPIH